MTELNGMMTYSEFIEHAGVKGMKWGKRKSKDSTPMTKAQKKVQKKKDTRNALLGVGAGAAAVAGGAYAANKLTKGALLKAVPTDIARRGASATAKTLSNVSSWKFVGGLSPTAIAATVGREFIYNFMQS